MWREVHTNIPYNGPADQEGLSYSVVRDDLLLVAVNTNFSGLGGFGHVESTWLDSVLQEHRDIRCKIVMGHHPVFPVNGYDERPLWCIVEDQAQAYLCSHVIAFDVQQHEGVLQVCSGDAGTNYGPGGFMGEDEYHHFVQAAIDEGGFHLQTIDIHGVVRERFSFPLLTDQKQ